LGLQVPPFLGAEQLLHLQLPLQTLHGVHVQNVADPSLHQVPASQDLVQGLIPGHVDEVHVDLSPHIVGHHQIESGLLGEDVEDRDHVRLPKVQ